MTQLSKVSHLEMFKQIPDLWHLCVEEYSREFEVDGEWTKVRVVHLSNMLPPSLHLESCDLHIHMLISSSVSFLQLEVLDTAGAEQFTAFNEMYIKVRKERRISGALQSARIGLLLTPCLLLSTVWDGLRLGLQVSSRQSSPLCLF